MKLLFLHLLAVSVWVGAFVTIAVVTRVVPRELPVSAQVAFFRSLGRGYGVVGSLALPVALSTEAHFSRGADGTRGQRWPSCSRLIGALTVALLALGAALAS